VAAVWAPPQTAAEPPVNAEDLRPGLIATYRDLTQPQPAAVVRLEPAIALAWKVNESAHPRLGADGGTAHWQGHLNILRPGAYRFSAVLRGRVRMTVGGKEVLAAELHEDKPAQIIGPEVQLEGAVQSVRAEFVRSPGVARLEVNWQAPFFRQEPLAADQLGHLPAEVPAQLATDRLVERGRFLAEERSCASCHQPADGDRLARGLVSRLGQDLSQVGQRAFPGWLYRWLEAPRKIRPGAAMPQMFADDDTGRAERFAVAYYLSSLGGPLRANDRRPEFKRVQEGIIHGRRLFTSIGCVACHGRPGEKAPTDPNPQDGRVTSFVPRPMTYPLSGLGSKTTPARLAVYLTNPLAVDPSGRMPHMLLSQEESRNLAQFLCQDVDRRVSPSLPPPPGKAALLAAFRRVDPSAEELAGFQQLSAEAQWLDLGKRVVIDKGCNNCHTLAPAGKPFAQLLADSSFDTIKERRTQTRGCLSDRREQTGKAPWFNLNDGERQVLRLFLQDGSSGAGSPAPAHGARVTLQRFNCLACHNRDGEGGLTPGLVEELRRFERADNAEAVNPPPLTGVGHKLRTPWLRQVLTQAGRARPWMGLRMPQFGEANVGRLPEALAALDGTEARDQVHKVVLSAARLDAGRRLVGKQAFGCISCHDLAGIANAGTRGPDLVSMDQRVRYDWYRRWLEQAQRMQPGTRMPIVFPAGKSLLADVLHGNADAQAEAIWAYLSLGSNLPLPDGLELPRGLVVTVKDRPVMLRTFMHDTSARAVAVGYPGGVSTAFDAATCRLAFAWSGNFLDAAPVWNDRGGNPAKELGPRFWVAPAACPLAVSGTRAAPDFATRIHNPAYGAAPPEGQLYHGPRRLLFHGYRTDAQGLPTFHYRLNADDAEGVEVSEKPVPLHSVVGTGLGRRFVVRVPVHGITWLLAGETSQEPRLLDATGAAAPLDLKASSLEVPAADRRLMLPQGGDRLVILVLSEAPAGTRWILQRQAKGWQALARLPAVPEATTVKIGFDIWVPYSNDPGLLKELVPANR
jgi:mono/diheme cytochrome c family protein